MSLKPVFFGIMAATMLLPAVQAEESPAAATPAAVPPNPMEERIRTYREQYDQQIESADSLREQQQAEMEQQRAARDAEIQGKTSTS